MTIDNKRRALGIVALVVITPLVYMLMSAELSPQLSFFFACYFGPVLARSWQILWLGKIGSPDPFRKLPTGDKT